MQRKLFSMMILFACAFFSTPAAAQTNEFTYQGKLSDSGTPSPTYDFEFRLCASEADCPTPLQTKERLGVSVSNGIFTVNLDFDAAHFSGPDRFLLISVRRNSTEPWTPLNPRQKITSSPYSIKSLNATSANSLVCNLCVTDAQIQSIDGSKVTGTVANATTANNVSGVVGIANGGTGGSTQNFVDLSTNQTSIGGDKTFTGVLSGNIVNATTQYDIAGLRMLSANGPYNEIAGNVPASNTFIGGLAGLNTTPDPSPSGFFGKLNSFFGAGAGQANTTGYLNSFFGYKAGASNTTATGNAFFGQSAGSRSTGASNSFFGRLSGNTNLGGSSNTAVGENADFTTNNATGNFNALLGSNTRVAANTNSQTAIGSASRTEAANSTAIGFGAYVTQSNSLVLGSINGLNNCAPPFCDSVKVGIGTTAPDTTLHLRKDAPNALGPLLTLTNGGGNGAAAIDFEGYNTAADPPAARIQSFDDTSFSSHLVFLTKLPGASANALAERMRIYSTGEISFQTLGSAGGIQLCRNLSNQISNCSSSLRYKTNIAPFSSGLSLINQLRPITFDWKQGVMRDVGFGAEEVAKINPLFITYNAQGEIEGVKYDRLSVAFVNAFKEQQQFIERQQKQIESQQQQIDAMKKLVCELKPEASICKEEQK